MPDGRQRKLWAGMFGLVWICTAGSGCQSILGPNGAGSNSVPVSLGRAAVPVTASAPVIGPQATLLWSIDSAQDARSVMCGQAQVGPGGLLEVGPYGSVPVAGLTPDQAQAAIEKHLAQYVAQPRVRVRLAQPDALVAQAASPKAAAPAPQQVVTAEWHTQTGRGEAQPGRIVRAAEQSLPPAPIPVQTTAWVSADPPKTEKPKTEKPKTLPATVEPLAPPRPVPPPAPATEAVFGESLPSSGCCGGGAGGCDDAPHECAKTSLPPYVIEPPDILLIETVQSLPVQKIRGQHLVRPDGMVGLGIYGEVFVGGMTLDEAKEVIIAHLKPRIRDLKAQEVNVDVLAYNSKFYYVVTDGGGFGAQVYRLPITGSETVLDAFAQLGGLPYVADKHHIWVARRPCSSQTGSSQVLPVDWKGIVQCGEVATNYQLMPGDRIFVQSDKWIRMDTWLARRLAIAERLLGITLLGSETVNSIKGTSGGSGSGSGTP